MKNKHHLIPQSRGGNNSSENILPFNIDKHNSFHHLYENQIIPERIWQEIQRDWHVLTDNFKRAIWVVLNMNPQDIYKEEFFKNTAYFNNLQSNFKEIKTSENTLQINREKTEEELIRTIGKICNVGNLEKLNKNDYFSKKKIYEITKLVISIQKQTNYKIGKIINEIKRIRRTKTLKKKRHTRLKIIESELKEYLKNAS